MTLDWLNIRRLPVFDVPGEPTPSPAPAPIRTALEGGGDPEPEPSPSPAPSPTPAPATLPENWRDFFADDDDGKKELGRFKSPKEVTKALLEQKKKLRQGIDPNEAAPEDAEQLKVWREARGIPPEPTGYKVPDAVKPQIKDVDKPIVDGYMEFMHKRNATQGQIDAGLEYYFGMEAATQADRAEADKVQMKETTGVLKEMWGADFKANAQIAKRASEELVPGVRWFDARLPDGRSLGNVPEVSDLLVQLGLQKWGEGAYESNKGGSDAVGDELGQLKALMNKDIKAWRANKTGQARYQELLEQKEKRGGR